MIAPTIPHLKRLVYAVRLWTFKAAVATLLQLVHIFRPRQFSGTAPSYTKTYRGFSSLPIRVFLPASPASSSSTIFKYPTYINIHGGGFAIGDAITDDPFAYALSQNHNLLVISINYPKGPRTRFPEITNSAATMVELILADKELPIDREKVAIGGFSAGGNLALSVALMPNFHDTIRAVVPVYPVTDFSSRYKGTYRPMKNGRGDFLRGAGNMFSWGYVNPGTDLTDPRLSPVYASRDDLPQKLFFVGAEYDVLCREAGITARKLAGFDDWMDIQEAGLELEKGWDRNGVRFMMVPNVQHAFTHLTYRGEEEKERLEKTEMTIREIGEWVLSVGLA